MNVRVGQIIDGYRIDYVLGAGGMGVVYLAFCEQIERRAAIKVLAPEFSTDAEFAARVLNEARAANRVQHPGIVQIFGFGHLPDGSAYIIMEYLEGESLRDRLRRAPRLSISEIIVLARQILDAIAAAHRAGIVHRDLKPDNVMLVTHEADAAQARAKILDFGIAKLPPRRDGETALTRAGSTLGTPAYMAPEQCTEAASVDGRADLYSLGVMLYEMLAGRPPFIAPTPFEVMTMHLRDEPPPLRRLVSQVPRPLCSLIEALLRKDPARRPGADKSMALLAQAALPGRAASSWIALGVGLLLLLGGAAGWLTSLGRPAQADPPQPAQVPIPVAIQDAGVAEPPDMAFAPRPRPRPPKKPPLKKVEPEDDGALTPIYRTPKP